MNQSEIEANTSNERQGRENECEQVTLLGLVLRMIGWESGASFFNQSESEV